MYNYAEEKLNLTFLFVFVSLLLIGFLLTFFTGSWGVQFILIVTLFMFYLGFL